MADIDVGSGIPFHYTIRSENDDDPLPADLSVVAALKASTPEGGTPTVNSPVAASFDVYRLPDEDAYLCQMPTDIVSTLADGLYYSDAVLTDANGNPSRTPVITISIDGGITGVPSA